MSASAIGPHGRATYRGRRAYLCSIRPQRYGVLVVLLLGAFALHAEPADLADVVVTASLRPGTILDVPGSVTVLDAAALRGAGQQHIQDVIALVPNLNWAGDTARPRYFQIRGIGELAQYQGAPNPSIGFLIDDIDFSGLGTAATLFDIDRIEVLRGPQGARYGANALGGLIYVTSAAPTRDYEGRIELGAGDYNTRSYGAVLNAPVTAFDSAVRVAVQRFTSDGYYRNAFLHRNDTARFDEVTLRGRWRAQPSDRLSIELTVLHTQLDDGYDDFSIDNRRTTLSDQPGEDSQHSTGVAAHVEYGLSAGTRLTAIASYADSPIKYSFDGDWGNLTRWAPYTYQSSEAQTRRRTTRGLEFRFADETSADTHWIVGLYTLALRESLRDSIANLYQDPTSQYLPATTDATTTSAYESRNVAAFGEVDHDLSQSFRVSAGLRAERRTVAYHDLLTSTGTASLTRTFAPTDDMWGGNLAVTWKSSADRSVYALVSRGYKDGGFNLSPGLPANELEFRPESDLNFELGFKADVANVGVHFDTAVFYTHRNALQLLTGTQLQANDPSTFVFYTGNAPSGFNAGLESTVEWQLAPALELGATLGLLKTQYRGFVQNAVIFPDRALPHAPSWQAAMHIAWKGPRGAFARLEFSGMGSFYFDLPPDPAASHAYGVANGRLGFEATRWSVTVWARNMLNKDFAVRGFYFGDEPPNFPNKLYVQLGPPRTLGADFTARF